MSLPLQFRRAGLHGTLPAPSIRRCPRLSPRGKGNVRYGGNYLFTASS